MPSQHLDIENLYFNQQNKNKVRTAYKPDSVQRLNLLDDHSSKVCITTNPIAAYPNLTPKQSRRPFQAFKQVPIRHCSRWGLPCRSCYQNLGGLLPHPFTLTRKTGGLLSVALSVGLPRPGVTRHRCFEESGLSSSILATIQPSA